MSTHTTRRALLKLGGGAVAYGAGAILISVAGVVTTAHLTPAHAASVDRTAWDRAFAGMTKAKVEYDRFAVVHDRVSDRWNSIFERKVAEVPFQCFPTVPRWEIIKLLDLDAYERDFPNVKGALTVLDDDPEHVRRACAKVREVRAFLERLDRRTGWPAIADRMDELGSLLSDRQTDLMEQPAPDAAALRWKLEHIIQNENGGTAPWAWDYVAVMMDDVKRFLPVEA